jgi:aspartyl/asparaginyl-tRNA synthetase
MWMVEAEMAFSELKVSLFSKVTLWKILKLSHNNYLYFVKTCNIYFRFMIWNFFYSDWEVFLSVNNMFVCTLWYLQDSMNCANDLFKYLCKWVMENCSDDLKFVGKRIDNTCIDRLRQIISDSPEIISYNEALDVFIKVVIYITKRSWTYRFDFRHMFSFSFQR